MTCKEGAVHVKMTVGVCLGAGRIGEQLSIFTMHVIIVLLCMLRWLEVCLGTGRIGEQFCFHHVC